MANNEKEQSNTRQKGSVAEDFAANYIKSQGYDIIDKNFYIRGGEIDIVAKKGDLIIFVEVRSWDRVFWENGTPLETVNPAKIRKIQKTALFYIQKKNINLQKTMIRFDVAGLTKEGDSYKIEYIENAFPYGGWR